MLRLGRASRNGMSEEYLPHCPRTITLWTKYFVKYDNTQNESCHTQRIFLMALWEYLKRTKIHASLFCITEEFQSCQMSHSESEIRKQFGTALSNLSLGFAGD